MAKDKPPVKTARECLDYLYGSGTPPKTLQESERWLAEQSDDEDAIKAFPAEPLYRHLEAHDLPDGVTMGTLRKAGKWIFGDEFEPQTAVSQAPAEELSKARGEIENLLRQLAQEKSRSLSYLKQRDIFSERLNEATRKLQALKAGRSHEELVEMGVEELATAPV